MFLCIEAPELCRCRERSTGKETRERKRGSEMEFSLEHLQPKERASFALRSLYETAGCRKYHMGRFEEYSLYQENRSFLSSEQVITFTDLDGRLLALKPDVTLSIVKNTKGSRDTAERVYYNENVYRARKGAGEYKEIMQVGLEYIGEVDAYATLEVLLLAQKSLKVISDAYILDVSHMGFVAGLMEEVALPYAQQDRILDCISEKNIHGIRAVCKENGVAADLTERLEGLASLYGIQFYCVLITGFHRYG